MAGGEVFVSFGGDTSGLEASIAVAKASVTDFTRELSALSREFVATGASAESELGQKVLAMAEKVGAGKSALAGLKSEMGGIGAHEAGGALEGVTGSLGRMREGAAGAVEHFRSLTATLVELAAIAGVAFGVDAFKEWVSSSAELGAQMESAAAKLGITANEASLLSGVAKLTDTDFASLSSTMERFQVGLAGTDGANSKVAAGLAALNLNARQLVGLPIPQQLETIAQAMSGVADGSNKTAIAVALFSRNGAEMLPYLDRGAAGIRDFEEAAQSAGAVMSNDMAAAFARTHEDLNEASLAWQGLSNKIFAAVNPAIDAATQKFTGFVSSLKQADIQKFAESTASALGDMMIASVTAFAQLRADVEDAINFLGRIGHVVGVLAGLFGTLAEKISGAASALSTWAHTNPLGVGTSLSSYQGTVAPGGARPPAPAPAAPPSPFGALPQPGDFESIAGRDFEQVVKENALSAGLAIKGMTESAEAARAQLKSLFTPPGSTARSDAAMGGAAYDGPGAALPQAPALQLGGGKGGGAAAEKNAIETQIEQLQTLQDAYKNTAKATEETLNEQLKTHQITMQQWVQQTVDALEDEKQDVQSAYAAELAIIGLTSKQIQDIKKQEQQALAAIASQEQQAYAKAAEETAQQWQQAFNTINGALTSQTSSLIAHTETWGEAGRKIISQLTTDVINLAAKMLLLDPAEKALTPMLSSMVTPILGAIKADAAAAFGGVFGFLAPVMGPAAAGPAAAASASVLAVAGGLYDSGAWEIPHDMLAGVHQGEMIVPQRGGIADQFRSALGGGGQSGGDTHFHFAPNVSAIDATGVQAFLGKYAPVFAKSIYAYQQRNPGTFSP